VNNPSQEIESQSQMAPLVSVLMPVFNTASYVEAAAKSILNQSFKDWELLIVDDGSTDGSLAILKRLAGSESRIRLIARANRGLIATRNELLLMARGEFIAWMDSDDISLPERLKTQVEYMLGDQSLACVGSAAQCIDPSGYLLNIERYPEEHLEIRSEQANGGAHRFPTTMMRRLLAQGVGGFREPLKMGEDFDFLLRLGEVGKLGNLAQVLYLYRQHVSSVCTAMGARWVAYRDYILLLARERREHGYDSLGSGVLPQVPEITAIERQRYESQIFLNWANNALQNGDGLRGVRYAWLAVARSPTSSYVWKSAARAVLKATRLT
jgi:glycosyltransferase involved in cell wall biosynthesis